jgi:ankyrin repeat protein
LALEFHLYSVVEILKVLCECGADANAQDAFGNTPLHWLASDRKEQRAEMIRVLKTAGANLDTRNFKAETPLHIAVRSGNLESAKALIGCGANLNVRISNGVNCTTDCDQRRLSSIASILRENEADLDLDMRD